MIDTLDIKVLMERLHEEPEPILRAIDADPKLKKREREDGLVIANASKALPEPTHTHQLYAKGIVYTRDPWRVVSMPLLKMYNHGRREHCDAWTRELLEKGAVVHFLEKLDGTMVQAFQWQGRLEFATRGMLEGMEPPTGFDYLKSVRAWAPPFLWAGGSPNRQWILEWISPRTRVVTDYQGLTALRLLEVVEDGERLGPGIRLEHWPTGHDMRKHVATWTAPLRGDPVKSFKAACLDLVSKADDPKHLPEGFVAVFVLDGSVRHAVKLKTPSYLKYHRLKYHMSWRRFFKARLEDPEAARDDVWEGLGVEEEVEQMYEAYWEAWEDWLEEVERIKVAAHDALMGFILVAGKGTMKDIALRFKGHEHFHTIMACARGKTPTLAEMARRYPPQEPTVHARET